MDTLWWLIVGHALGDFVLQTDTMAKGKSRHRRLEPSLSQYLPTWQYWLTSHALIHGGIVTLATGSTLLGFAEFVAHWVIDFGKNEQWYGLHTDQGLHLVCKLGWFTLA